MVPVSYVSDDDWGVKNHLQNAKYWGSMLPFSEADIDLDRVGEELLKNGYHPHPPPENERK